MSVTCPKCKKVISEKNANPFLPLEVCPYCGKSLTFNVYKEKQKDTDFLGLSEEIILSNRKRIYSKVDMFFSFIGHYKLFYWMFCILLVIGLSFLPETLIWVLAGFMLFIVFLGLSVINRFREEGKSASDDFFVE